MEHLISKYYKEDYYHRIYYTIFAPFEQKEKKRERDLFREIRYSLSLQLILRNVQDVVCLFTETNKSFSF